MSKPITVEIELKLIDSPELEKAIATQIKKAVTKSTAEIVKLLEGEGDDEDSKGNDRTGSNSDDR